MIWAVLAALGIPLWFCGPQENVEVIRSLYEMGAGDWFSLAPDEIDRAFREYVDEDFEARLPTDYPEGEPVFRGRDGFDELTSMLADAWGTWRLEPERFLDAGDRVVVFARIVAEGGASGVPLELETTHVWTVRAGRATHLQAYRDRSEALEVAGLEE
jgi:ketosteroid isomerase-like protein